MPTEIERLKKGRDRKAKMLNYFGFMPLSVLRLKNPQIKMADLFNYQFETGKSTSANRIKQMNAQSKKGNTQKYDASTWSGKGIGRGKDTFSIMPPPLVDFFIKFYSKPGELYFDPFMGQGMQLQVANIRGVNYIGYDICKDYVDYINKFIPKLNKKSEILEAHFKDSKKVQLDDNTVDFCFTSPPYWDIEVYDDHKEQLGVGKTYEEFLEGMKEVAKELHRVFKKEGYCVINVNDFKKDGKFYSYHSDIIQIFKEVGWDIHDIWILDEVTSGLVKIFASNMVANKRAPKVHEYAIVFKK